MKGAHRMPGWWPFRRGCKPGDGRAARLDAEDRVEQAQEAVARAEMQAAEAHIRAAVIRQHNEANHYDDMILRVIGGAR